MVNESDNIDVCLVATCGRYHHRMQRWMRMKRLTFFRFSMSEFRCSRAFSWLFLFLRRVSGTRISSLVGTVLLLRISMVQIIRSPSRNCSYGAAFSIWWFGKLDEMSLISEKNLCRLSTSSWFMFNLIWQHPENSGKVITATDCHWRIFQLMFLKAERFLNLASTSLQLFRPVFQVSDSHALDNRAGAEYANQREVLDHNWVRH